MGPADSSELREYLESLRPGEFLCGTVARIEPFGVFVALDDGPGHPVFPGVGFITYPELSWRIFEAATDVVADHGAPGQEMSGQATKLIQFGTFVAVGDGIEGLVHIREIPPTPVRAGDEVRVVVAEVDRERRRLTLSWQQASP